MESHSSLYNTRLSSKENDISLVYKPYVTLVAYTEERPFTFVTDRLVDSPRLKRALESIYTGILPKGTSPFVYLRCVILGNPAKLSSYIDPA